MLVRWVVLRSYPVFLNAQNPVLGLVSHLHRTAMNQWLKRHTDSHGGDPGVPEKSNRVYGTEIGENAGETALEITGWPRGK